MPFVAALHLAELGLDGVAAAETGRPGYHPSTLLTLYVYGYLNRVQSRMTLTRTFGRPIYAAFAVEGAREAPKDVRHQCGWSAP